MNPSTMRDRLRDNEKPRACRQCLYFRENGNRLVKIRHNLKFAIKIFSLVLKLGIGLIGPIGLMGLILLAADEEDIQSAVEREERLE